LKFHGQEVQSQKEVKSPFPQGPQGREKEVGGALLFEKQKACGQGSYAEKAFRAAFPD
jgi:hypothetical protein